MKTFMIVLVLFIAQGCVTSTYSTTHPSGVEETFKLTTWFKSVDGLSVIRTPDLFGLKIDSTHTNDDAITAVARILDYYSGKP